MMTLLLEDALPVLAVCVLLIALLRRLARLLIPLVLVAAVVMAFGVTLTGAAPRTVRTPPPCGAPPKAVLTVYRLDMPTIAAHIAEAQRANPGWRVLCRNGLDASVDEPGVNRRKSVCGGLGSVPREGWSCDEYPFASTYQGGEYASFAIVPEAENSRQGGQLSRFYRASAVRAGDTFLVVVV